MTTYIPYQLCPKCNGDGTVLVQNWNQHETSISGGLQTCNLCNGAKIIPMYEHPHPPAIKSLPEYNEILYHAKTLTDEQFREYWNEVQGNVC